MNCSMSLSNMGATAAATLDPSTQMLIATQIGAIKERALTSFSIAVAVLPMLHAMAHLGIRMCSARNRSVTEEQCLTASHHVVELLLGVLLFPPMLEVTRRLVLCHPAETYSSDFLLDIGTSCSLTVCAMYSAELASRSSRTRPLTALHHLLTMAFLICTVAATDELITVVGSIFIAGALAEAPLFAGLLFYRFRAGRERLAWWVLFFGIVTYGLSRVAQAVAHVAVLAAFDLSTFPPSTLFWVVGGGGLLELIQLHTFVIYRSILLKVMPTKTRPRSTSQGLFGSTPPVIRATCASPQMDVKKSRVPIPHQEYSVEAARPPLRILSLDGCGAKGLNTIMVLQALEKACGQPLNEMFDYVAGASVGGAVALGVAAAKEEYSMAKINDFLEQVCLRQHHCSCFFVLTPPPS